MLRLHHLLSEDSSLIIVAFLLPLALYFFFLGMINSRRRPLMIPGPWDFAGILFAASGFLTFGIPAILTGLSERWRLFWWTAQLAGNLSANPEDTKGIGGGLWAADGMGGLLWAAYFLLVLVVAGIVLWRRQTRRPCTTSNPPLLKTPWPPSSIAWGCSGPAAVTTIYFAAPWGNLPSWYPGKDRFSFPRTRRQLLRRWGNPTCP